jgi:hypothetical protein
LKFLRVILILSALHFLPLAGFGQRNPASNLRNKAIDVKADSLVLDTLSIIPNTFTINLPDSAYRLDFISAVLHLSKPLPGSIRISYRVFPVKLNKAVQGINFDSIKNNLYIEPFEFNRKSDNVSKGIFDFGNMEYNGSFGRGISFGNNQDAVVNSNFNLQLNGMLPDSIAIAAAITDNNIPIQPDGTTQELNEFDQVFLQFKKNNWQLNLGDIDLRQSELYFLNFYKRLEGVSFQARNQPSSNLKTRTLVSGSIARGRFHRNIIDKSNTPRLEGNQGPYRLKGANNEIFFIVLANTERVFLDGELLQRGEDQDYVINYNTAEISFTPRRMITKDSRIQVEFEYADRNFLNSNLYVFQTMEIRKKLNVRVGAFQNTDAKNSQINQTLDDKQRRFLFDIGDSINQAYYPTINIDSFSKDRILYEKVYFLNGSLTDSFYRYSTDSSTARYSLSFTDVGAGNGNYVPDFNGANGKVFRFVTPVNGIKQGQYEPVMKLVTPKKHQVLSVAADYQLNKHNLIKTEIGLSKYDVNTFSSKDAADDNGLAFRLQYANNVLLNTAKELSLTTSFDVEHVQQRFHPLERLRYVEFSREWGLPLNTPSADEDILRVSSQLKNRNAHSLSYQFMSYKRSDDYKGFQHIISHSLVRGGWTLANQAAITNFSSAVQKGSFFRPVIDISKEFKQLHAIRLGVRYALEKNELHEKQTDTLLSEGFSFDTYTAYLKTDQRKKNKYTLNFFTRSDRYPLQNGMVQADKSYNINTQAEILKSEHHQFLINATYRKLDVQNTKLSKEKTDNTILGRVEYMINEWKGLVTGNALYETGAGQEQKRDVAYVEVPAGKGEYTWIDYNSDGRQQLNEFETALFPDQARFIRIFVPTNQFVKANYSTLNYSFNFNPKAIFKDPVKGFKNFIARLSWLTSMQKSKKAISKGDFQLDPFKYDIRDTALLTATTSFNNTVSFNRFSNKWGIDLSNVQNTGKSLLTYGYETRKLADWLLKFRTDISSSVTFNIISKKGSNSLFTPKFSNRNYDLEIYSAEPQLVYVNRSVFRLQGSYKIDARKNDPLYGGEHSLANSFHLDMKYNVVTNSSVNTRFTFSQIDYKFPANSTVSYIMLDGLLPGTNYLWGVDYTKRLLNNIELSLQYDGRKAAASHTIHTGRASIRAIF